MRYLFEPELFNAIGYHGFDLYKTLIQDERFTFTEKDKVDIDNEEDLPVLLL